MPQQFKNLQDMQEWHGEMSPTTPAMEVALQDHLRMLCERGGAQAYELSIMLLELQKRRKKAVVDSARIEELQKALELAAKGAHLQLPTEVEVVRCTSVSASWCPIHGECTCDGDEVSDDKNCPLHSDQSNHASYPFNEE